MDILQGVWAMLVAAVEGASLPLILTLIGMDLALGIFCAIKKGAFEWARVGQFYQTMVVPYVGGYLVFLIAFSFLPDLGDVLSPALSGIALGAILVTLVTSIKGHVCDLGLGEALKARGLSWCD